MTTLVHSAQAAPTGVTSVAIDLPGREYEVVIGPGLVPSAGQAIASRFKRLRCAVVTDENVAAHHLAPLEESLKALDMHRGTITVKPGEASKSFPVLADVCEKLLAMQVERGDAVIALGGGVVGDLAGFAASILRRGVKLIQLPTSLLAQVDSSVGGKTGINTPQGKNLIGTFHQPSLVLADTDTLTTLPDREMRAGYAEVAKYGLISDAGLFKWLEQNARHILAHDEAAQIRAIEAGVRIKADVVIADEREGGPRALLNLGHTFGHALEAHTGYGGRLLHGEGVAIGMAMAARLSERLGLCPQGCAARAQAHLSAAGLPTRLSQVPGGAPETDRFIALMEQDKKVQDGHIAFILLRDIGDAFVSRDVGRTELAAFLDDELRS